MNYYTPSGNLTSPGYPGQIPNGLLCNYFVKVDTAYAIRFVLEYFDTEDFKDTLTFGPGPEIDLGAPNAVEIDGNLTDLPLAERTYDIGINQVWFDQTKPELVKSSVQTKPRPIGIEENP